MDEDIYILLLNGMPFREFIVYYVVSLIGALIFVIKDFNVAIYKDPNTPAQFEWKYIGRGLSRIVIGMICLVFGIIYFPELSKHLVTLDMTGLPEDIHAHDIVIDINTLSAFGLGLGVDKLVKKFVGTTIKVFKK